MKCIIVEGFDPENGWDPSVTLEDDSIVIEFPEFPPTWMEGPTALASLEAMDTFHEALIVASGREVAWEDREFFRVFSSSEKTFDRVVSFLQTYYRGAK